jgi:hypothetical protein
MPVEGRDLSSRRTQDVVRDLGIGQPINSEEYTDRVDAIHFIGHWDAASQSERSFCADPAYGFRPGRVAKIRTPDTHPGWFPKEIPSVWMSGNAKVA